MTLARKTPLTGTGFLRSKTRSARPVGVLGQASHQAIRSKLKSSRPKMTPIRKAARGQDCTLRLPCCNHDPETTVWAHSNRYEDGKGMGIKARDEEGCFACSACHAFLDGGYANAGWDRLALDSYFNRARAASQAILRQKGLL